MHARVGFSDLIKSDLHAIETLQIEEAIEALNLLNNEIWNILQGRLKVKAKGNPIELLL